MGAFEHSIRSKGEAVGFILTKSPPFARGVVPGQYVDRCITGYVSTSKSHNTYMVSDNTPHVLYIAAEVPGHLRARNVGISPVK